jgi:hypothetical protein
MSAPEGEASVLGSPSAPVGLDDLWEFRCSQMSWQPVAVRAPILSKRFGHSLAYTHGRLYAFGGVDARTMSTLGDFWMLDDNGNAGKRWCSVIPHGSCSAGSSSGADDASVMCLQRPCARSHHSLVPAPDGCLLLHGGISSHGAILNDIWCVRVTHEATLVGAYDPLTEASLGSNLASIPLVVWRRVELPGDCIPRKLGSTVVVAPMPKLSQANRRASTAAAIVTFHQVELPPTPQYLVLICGGWDAASMSPFIVPHSQSTANLSTQYPFVTSEDEPSPMMRRLASMAFSSVDGGASFRFGSFRRGSSGDALLRLEKSVSPYRRRQSQAERENEDTASSQHQQQCDQQQHSSAPLRATTKRQPVVVAFAANMENWRIDHSPSEFTSSPRSSAAHGDVHGHGAMEIADSESSASHGVGGGGQGGRGVSPPPKHPTAAVPLSKYKVLGKRFTAANSAGRLSQSTFAHASRRSCDYAASMAALQKQLAPHRLEMQRLDVVATSSALVPPAVTSPTSRTGPPLLDVSALAVKDDDTIRSAAAINDGPPTSTMFGCWCRSYTAGGGKSSQTSSAVELTMFGGNCGPMVAYGDIWRCRLEWLPQPMFDVNKTVPFHSL